MIWAFKKYCYIEYPVTVTNEIDKNIALSKLSTNKIFFKENYQYIFIINSLFTNVCIETFNCFSFE